jgi:hypothetical protein
MMASAMRATPGVRGAVFAAGISNSLEKDEAKYAREERELSEFVQCYSAERIIYFSSFVAAAGQTRYALHKRKIESIISRGASDFLILRLPQVVGPTQNKTLISYLVQAARTGETIAIHHRAFRSLVDVDDVGRIISLLIAKNVTREIIAVGPSHPLAILDIVRKVESVLGVRINRRLVDDGDRQSADLTRIRELLDSRDPLQKKSYQNLVLEKYVPVLFADAAVGGRCASAMNSVRRSAQVPAAEKSASGPTIEIRDHLEP